MSVLLETRALSKHFSGVAAVDEVDLRIAKGEILAVVGPNGSGKTTLFNVTSGFLKPTTGSVWFEGRRIDESAPHLLPGRGIARTFQQAMTFGELSVRETVMVPGYTGRFPKVDVNRLLRLCGLGDQAEVAGNALPYGRQRSLGVALALATSPRLLLLDEPAAGLSEEDAARLAALIRDIRDEGVSVAVIDHNMHFLLPIADRIMVMETGRVIFDGTTADMQAHQRVIDVYLGQDVV